MTRSTIKISQTYPCIILDPSGEYKTNIFFLKNRKINLTDDEYTTQLEWICLQSKHTAMTATALTAMEKFRKYKVKNSRDFSHKI